MYSLAYCIWSVISSSSNLNRCSSSLGLFCQVLWKRDQGDWDWRLRLNDTPNATGWTKSSTHDVISFNFQCVDVISCPMWTGYYIKWEQQKWHSKCNRLECTSNENNRNASETHDMIFFATWWHTTSYRVFQTHFCCSHLMYNENKFSFDVNKCAAHVMFSFHFFATWWHTTWSSLKHNEQRVSFMSMSFDASSCSHGMASCLSTPHDSRHVNDVMFSESHMLFPHETGIFVNDIIYVSRVMRCRQTWRHAMTAQGCVKWHWHEWNALLIMSWHDLLWNKWAARMVLSESHMVLLFDVICDSENTICDSENTICAAQRTPEQRICCCFREYRTSCAFVCTLVRYSLKQLRIENCAARTIFSEATAHLMYKQMRSSYDILWSNAMHIMCSDTTYCNILQHTATHCNTLQHTATHCNTCISCALIQMSRWTKPPQDCSRKGHRKRNRKRKRKRKRHRKNNTTRKRSRTSKTKGKKKSKRKQSIVQ